MCERDNDACRKKMNVEKEMKKKRRCFGVHNKVSYECV